MSWFFSLGGTGGGSLKISKQLPPEKNRHGAQRANSRVLGRQNLGLKGQHQDTWVIGQAGKLLVA